MELARKLWQHGGGLAHAASGGSDRALRKQGDAPREVRVRVEGGVRIRVRIRVRVRVRVRVGVRDGVRDGVRVGVGVGVRLRGPFSVRVRVEATHDSNPLAGVPPSKRSEGWLHSFLSDVIAESTIVCFPPLATWDRAGDRVRARVGVRVRVRVSVRVWVRVRARARRSPA